MTNSTARYCPVIGITIYDFFSSLFTGVNFIAVLNFVRTLGPDSDLSNRINSKLLHRNPVITSDQNLSVEL